jgi:glycosyltransferase involved in cell wall biosynthesis
MQPTAPDVLVSVVMPCFNERPTVRHSVERVLEAPFRKELLVVDGGCRTCG